jgi:hypothetical protein
VIVQATHSPEATHFLYQNLRIDVGPCLRMIEARSDEGELLGVVGFNTWMGGSVAVHIAVHDSHAFLPLFRHSLRYAFGQLKLKAALGFVNGSRKNWIRGHLKTMDYRYVGTIAGGGLGNDDLVILELRPENCRMWQRMLQREQHQEAHVG